MEHLDGIKGNGASAYFRTKDRKTPHNAYASGPKLRQAIEASGYADAYLESYEGHYTFAPESAPVCFEDGIAAAKVVPGYQLSNPWFEYHPEDGLYYRYQYGGPHMGDEGQIAVKNIISNTACGNIINQRNIWISMSIHRRRGIILQMDTAF